MTTETTGTQTTGSTTSAQAPSTATSPTGGPTAAQGATPAQGAAPAPTGGQGGPSKPVDRSSLKAALKRTQSIKDREQQLARQAEDLRPLLEAQELIKGGKHADAVRRLAGGDAELLKVYDSLTLDVAGAQQQQKSMDDLPAPLRAQLAELETLKKKAEMVDALEQRLQNIERTRDEASQAIEDRRRTGEAQRLFTAGFESLSAEGGEEARLIASLPTGRARLEQKWLDLLGEKSEAIGALPVEQRTAALSALVPQAARALRDELREEFGDLLRLPPVKGNLYGNRSTSPVGRAVSAPEKAPAPSTSGTHASPKTVMPGSLGEPAGVDWRKLTPNQRFEQLRRMEREAARAERNG